MSEGQFEDVRPDIVNKTSKDIDESTDTFDTVEWLLKDIANDNGRVGIYGISYPGFYTSAGIIDSHPAIKAASPQAPVSDWFMGDDMHHNGALFLAQNYSFFTGFGQPRPTPTATNDYLKKWNGRNTPDGYDFSNKPRAERNRRSYEKAWESHQILGGYDGASELDDWWKERTIFQS